MSRNGAFHRNSDGLRSAVSRHIAEHPRPNAGYPGNPLRPYSSSRRSGRRSSRKITPSRARCGRSVTWFAKCLSFSRSDAANAAWSTFCSLALHALASSANVDAVRGVLPKSRSKQLLMHQQIGITPDRASEMAIHVFTSEMAVIAELVLRPRQQRSSAGSPIASRCRCPASA